MPYYVVLPNGVVQQLETEDTTIKYAVVGYWAEEGYIVEAWTATKSLANEVASRGDNYWVVDVWLPSEGEYIMIGDVLAWVLSTRGQYIYYEDENSAEGRVHVLEVRGVVDPEVYITVVEELGYTRWVVVTPTEEVHGYLPGSHLEMVRKALVAHYRPVLDYLPTSPGCHSDNVVVVTDTAATGIHPVITTAGVEYGQIQPVKKTGLFTRWRGN